MEIRKVNEDLKLLTSGLKAAALKAVKAGEAELPRDIAELGSAKPGFLRSAGKVGFYAAAGALTGGLLAKASPVIGGVAGAMTGSFAGAMLGGIIGMGSL